MNKTRITYIPPAATPLPTAAQVVTLFNSVTAFGKQSLPFHNLYWLTYSVRPGKNTTGNSVTGQYSNDGGTNWIEFYASTTNEPVGDSTTFTDEVYIGHYQDVRLLFNNGALAQDVFTVNLSLDGSERSTAGV